MVYPSGQRSGKRFPPVLRGITASWMLMYGLVGPAVAQDDRGASANQASTPLEEIIVSAERRTRSLMDTATSVAVFDDDALRQRPDLEGINDLFARIPNITSSGSSNFAPAVRGVDGTGPAEGATAFIAGTRSRLNIQIDGRPATYNEIVFGNVGIWDVERVEVLRGPQSALQGRNAIAGTLAVKTKDPTYDTELRFRGMAGNLATRQYSGVISAPIVDDQLAFRLSADHRSSDSYVDYSPFTSPLANVEDPSKREMSAYRGKLLFEPKAWDGFSALLTVNHAKKRGPQNEEAAEPVDDDFTPRFPFMPTFVPETTSSILDMTWTVSEALEFQTLFSYTDLEVERWARPVDAPATIDGREFVAESLVRFDSTGGRLSGLVGVYYFDSQQDEFLDLLGGGTFDDSTQTIAGFAEGTYALSEQFDLTVGARYEVEDRRRQGVLAVFNVDLDETYKEFLPKLVLSWHANDRLTLGAMASRGYNGGGAGVTFAPPFTVFTFGPEIVWTYEGFARASLAGDELLLTANVFHSDYEDMQLPFNLGGLATVIRNADQAVTYGAELSTIWQATPSLQLSAGLGLLQTDIEEYPGSGLEGNELPRSPGVTGSFGAVYENEGFEFSLDGRYSDAYFSDIDNAQARQTDSYWRVSAQAGYSFSRVRIFSYVKNLFDADASVQRLPEGFNGDGMPVPPGAIVLAPRTYGIGFEIAY